MFHLLEWGSNPQPVGFTVTLCAPAPRLSSEIPEVQIKNTILLRIVFPFLFDNSLRRGDGEERPYQSSRVFSTHWTSGPKYKNYIISYFI